MSNKVSITFKVDPVLRDWLKDNKKINKTNNLTDAVVKCIEIAKRVDDTGTFKEKVKFYYPELNEEMEGEDKD